MKILGREVIAEDVKDIGGDEAIPDLMLYRRYADRVQGRYEHLVVELKRPKLKLGEKELSQIKKYAYTIADDPRFDKAQTKWTFVLLGDDLNEFAEQECEQQNRQYGHIVAKPNVDVFVQKWATVIQDCKWRHEFYRNALELEIKGSDGEEFLRKKYSEYLPEPIARSLSAEPTIPDEAESSPKVRPAVKPPGKKKKKN